MLRSFDRKAVLLMILLASPSAALAGGRLNVTYVASVTAIPVGQGEFIIDVTDDGYAAAGSAKVVGIAKLVSRGEGVVAARGNIADGKLSPISYSTSSESDKKKEEIKISMANNAVTEFSVFPPQDSPADRVPVTERDREGVVDPMSAAILPVAGNGDMLAPQNCNRTVPIFDGRYRYDLVFHYERTEIAKDVKGYNGKMLVCRVDYKPVAGHKPSRIQVKFMEDNKNIFVWLAPIQGTRVLFPVRVSIVTLIGIVVVQAENFSSGPAETQAANPSPK